MDVAGPDHYKWVSIYFWSCSLQKCCVFLIAIAAHQWSALQDYSLLIT